MIGNVFFAPEMHFEVYFVKVKTKYVFDLKNIFNWVSLFKTYFLPQNILLFSENLKPVLSVAPDGPLTFLGGSVILTCVLLEVNVTFTWFCDAAEVHRSQHNQFIIQDVQKSHSCTYRCYGSFEHWPRFSFWSNAVNLTVIREWPETFIIWPDNTVKQR